MLERAGIGRHDVCTMRDESRGCVRLDDDVRDGSGRGRWGATAGAYGRVLGSY